MGYERTTELKLASRRKGDAAMAGVFDGKWAFRREGHSFDGKVELLCKVLEFAEEEGKAHAALRLWRTPMFVLSPS